MVRNSVVLAVYLLFSVACFFTVHEHYYMVYSVPLNVDLTELSHYPSIAISKDDL